LAEAESKGEVVQSVADRVLSAFIAAVAEEVDLAEVVPRLKVALLETDNLKEDALRSALFGEGGA
jgi:hypothetical protein